LDAAASIMGAAALHFGIIPEKPGPIRGLLICQNNTYKSFGTLPISVYQK
jgi:hypothetical protein